MVNMLILQRQPQSNFLDIDCSVLVERAAQRYAGLLVARAKEHTAHPPEYPMADQAASTAPTTPVSDNQYHRDFQEVDVNSLQQTQPRSVGVEHLGLNAMAQLGLIEKLEELDINGVTRSAIIGNLIGRMAHPASEIATHKWLQSHSSLGELCDVDFAGMSHMAL